MISLTDIERLAKNASITDGVPCDHKGCLCHVSHPCESCGRIAGRSNVANPDTILKLIAVCRAAREVAQSQVLMGERFVGYSEAFSNMMDELKEIEG